MTRLRDDARGVPARYWVVASAGSLVLPALGLSDAEGRLLLEAPAGLGALIALVVVAAATAAPLLAVVRPIAMVGLSLAWMLPGVIPVLAFSCIAGSLLICTLAAWRRPMLAVLGGLGALAAVVSLVVRQGDLIWGGADGAQDGVFRWFHEDTAELVQDLTGWIGVFLATAAFAAWLRWSGRRALATRRVVARAAEVEQQSAVTAERARLARDLHDVVAHHVSLIAVRAETAPYTHPGLDDQARGVLTEIAGDARLALDELRDVLGVLDRADHESDRAPQPGLGEVPALIERTRSAGVEVVLHGDTAVPVVPSVGYVAYRVVQEALTNARRHAPGAVVEVRVEVSEELLVVAVSNPAVTSPGNNPGHGLAGMRERAEAVGGHLEVGVRGGHFTVRAALPRRER